MYTKKYYKNNAKTSFIPSLRYMNFVFMHFYKNHTFICLPTRSSFSNPVLISNYSKRKFLKKNFDFLHFDHSNHVDY